jgi:hypothetical protein
VKEKLTLSLSTLLDYLVLYGFDRKGFETLPTLRHWQLCSAECGWIKFLKYKLAAFFSDFLGVVVPKQPFKHPDHPMLLLGGRGARFIRKILKTDRALSFATGILYLKKGMPRPDESMLEAARIATKEVLTHPRPIPVSRILVNDQTAWEEPWRPLSLEDMADEVRRTCFEVFRGHKFTEEDMHKMYAPSVKASYTSNRSALGTYGDLIESGLITDITDQDRSFGN